MLSRLLRATCARAVPLSAYSRTNPRYRFQVRRRARTKRERLAENSIGDRLLKPLLIELETNGARLSMFARVTGLGRDIFGNCWKFNDYTPVRRISARAGPRGAGGGGENGPRDRLSRAVTSPRNSRHMTANTREIDCLFRQDRREKKILLTLSSLEDTRRYRHGTRSPS